MDFEISDEEIGVLKGSVAAKGYQSFPQAKRLIKSSRGKRVFLNGHWHYTFIEARKGFYAVNLRDPTKVVPICPCQNPPCDYYTGGSLICPVHGPDDEYPALPCSDPSGRAKSLEILPGASRVIDDGKAASGWQ